MSNFQPSQLPDYNLENICQDLATFGSKGHERIRLVKDQQGHYYPRTASKPRWICWFISLFYKKETSRAKIVATFVLEFLHARQAEIDAIKSQPNSQAALQLIHTFNRLDAFLEKAQIQKNDQVIEWSIWSMKAFPRTMKDMLAAISEQAKAILNTALIAANKIRDEAKDQAAALNQEKAAIVARLKEKEHVQQKEGTLAPLPPHSASAYAFRENIGDHEGIISFECSDGEIVKVHKAILKYHSRKGDNFFSGIVGGHFSESQNPEEAVPLKDYPSSTVQLLLDFLYGVPKDFKADQIDDLLRLIDLTDKLLLSNIKSKIKGICSLLFAQSPTLVFDALLSPIVLQNIQLYDWVDSKVSNHTIRELSANERSAIFTKTSQLPEGMETTVRLISLCHQRGIGTPKNEQFAFEILSKYASQYPSVQRVLGYCYEFGKGVDKDMKKAVACYFDAAKQGYVLAQALVGSCYFDGLEVAEDFNQAFEHYQLVADQGEEAGQIGLGNCYLLGNGVAKDLSRAFDCYQLAADQGSSLGQVNVGDSYRNREGVKQNFTEAFKFYKLAADQRCYLGQQRLGNCYEYGIGVAKDRAKAFQLYQLAFENEPTDSQTLVDLGRCYQYRIGVARDRSKAFEYYQLAVKHDPTNASALVHLGRCYLNGHGIDIDANKALELFKQAVEHDEDETGCLMLAVCYEIGKGVAKDLIEARKWYIKAAELGSEEAKERLAELA